MVDSPRCVPAGIVLWRAIRKCKKHSIDFYIPQIVDINELDGRVASKAVKSELFAQEANVVSLLSTILLSGGE